MTVLTLNIHHHGNSGKQVPILVQRIAFGYIAKFLFMNTGYYHSINEHVEYFYTKEHGRKDSLEERRHLAWLAKKYDGSGTNVTPTLNRLSQRTSAPTVCSPFIKEHNVSVCIKIKCFLGCYKTGIFYKRASYTKWDVTKRWRKFDWCSS